MYLATRFRNLGGVIIRAKLAAIGDAQTAASLSEPPKLIINCSALGSLTLSDVKDEAMYPTRGQLCVIRAPWMKYGKTVTGKGKTSYSIPRSNGMVILGGTREAGDW